MGELGTALILETHFPKEDLSAASEGWGGDTFAIYKKEGAGTAVFWMTTWDREADAVEFETQARRLGKALGASFAARKKASVVTATGIPAELKDGLLEAAWTCSLRKGKIY